MKCRVSCCRRGTLSRLLSSRLPVVLYISVVMLWRTRSANGTNSCTEDPVLSCVCSNVTFPSFPIKQLYYLFETRNVYINTNSFSAECSEGYMTWPCDGVSLKSKSTESSTFQDVVYWMIGDNLYDATYLQLSVSDIAYTTDEYCSNSNQISNAGGHTISVDGRLDATDCSVSDYKLITLHCNDTSCWHQLERFTVTSQFWNQCRTIYFIGALTLAVTVVWVVACGKGCLAKLCRKLSAVNCNEIDPATSERGTDNPWSASRGDEGLPNFKPLVEVRIVARPPVDNGPPDEGPPDSNLLNVAPANAVETEEGDSFPSTSQRRATLVHPIQRASQDRSLPRDEIPCCSPMGGEILNECVKITTIRSDPISERLNNETTQL